MHIDPNKLYAVMKDKYSRDPVCEILGVNPGNGKLILWRDNFGAIASTAHADISYVVLGVEHPSSMRLSPGEVASMLGRMNIGQLVQQRVPPAPASPLTLTGFVVQAEAGGRPTVLHQTQVLAEQEAMRLASANTGIAFYVQPMYAGKAISKASVPKPVATLEKL